MATKKTTKKKTNTAKKIKKSTVEIDESLWNNIVYLCDTIDRNRSPDGEALLEDDDEDEDEKQEESWIVDLKDSHLDIVFDVIKLANKMKK